MFHSKDGWFWKREEDGSVTVEHHTPAIAAGEGLFVVDATGNFPDNYWASIVASVSTLGEGNHRWDTALDFHNDDGKDSKDSESNKNYEPIKDETAS